MLNKIKNLENEFTVGKAAFIIGVFTLLSKLVALFRDPLILSRIGVGDTTDIYFSAFRIPDFIFQLLVLGTLSVAFIPVFTEWLITDKDKAYRVANSILNAALLGMGLVCVILLIFSAPLTKLLVPGFSGEKLIRTIQLTRLFLLSPLIFTASSVFTSILSSYKKFLMLSLAPILYNLGIIAGLFFLYPRFGLTGLGIGVIVGAFLHMSVQIPEVLRYGFRWQGVLDWRDASVRKIAKLFLPRVIGLDISQVSLIIGTTVGSILAAGSVTIFNAANNLQTVPLGVFALSVSQASFPLLSEYFAKGDQKAFLQTLSDNIIQVMFFIVPVAILMIMFRWYLVQIIYGHGKFTDADIVSLALTFGIMTVGLFGQSLSPLFSRSFYAMHNTIIPVAVNVSSIILNAGLTYFLGRHYGLPGIATAFAFICVYDSVLMAIFLRLHLSKGQVPFGPTDSLVASSMLKILLASAGMAVIGWVMIYLINIVGSPVGFVDTLVKSGIAVLISAITFVTLANYLKLNQAKQLLAILGKIF
ncbi:MAG: murein biosynthesis integral membrane protein MurJ [Candidatus Doudnabacteria bacterium]|nr:murein biosynthesis integral membrane protein MurJ [Candidatus Doudnabacteria bacterium]